MMFLPTVLFLASCGGGDDVTAVENRNMPETGATAAVAKLDPDLRNGVLEKAIKASGVACPSVTGSERAEVRPGVKGWKAQCNNETAHLIEILPDGTAKVTSRTY
ncbi:hypothetical protein PMI04_003690 [Sphingobium sp. AP49]|uniref:hypothetical protein n=1 Tax=Sphingobium sp. AP49 TaxID=1144307 RepID=UPI00056AD895|nr:hypothetical protein [Sphingobium sp. AP49]WHO39707.1 hypothetical protein PMI04_003690 [Sphingobium sp. AP49]